MRLLSGAWTAEVIWYLREGKRCFTELQTDVKGVSAKMLSTRLRILEGEGVPHHRTDGLVRADTARAGALRGPRAGSRHRPAAQTRAGSSCIAVPQ